MDEHTAETHNRKLTLNTIYSSAKNCKHVSHRALDAVEIFITTVIDFMFGVNYSCLLNLKPVPKT